MPVIDLTGAGALVSALAGLLVAAGSIALQRQRRSAVDADEMEDELEIRTIQYQKALRHIRNLEEDRAAYSDLPPLPRPNELQAGYFQAQQGRGRRRRATDSGENGPDAADPKG